MATNESFIRIISGDRFDIQKEIRTFEETYDVDILSQSSSKAGFLEFEDTITMSIRLTRKD